jgi:dipeptidyl aminopeptidase/acylaminoacyl peptidase
MNRQFTFPLLFLILFLAATAPAQIFYFGRNKVAYTNFEWHVLKTEHFDIYYYPEMKDLAERGAAFAEEAYTDLQVKFNHTLGNRVPLIFYSSHLHFQQTNTTEGFIPEGIGGFFEFMKGRVVLPSDGSSYQFRHVVRHELVHVFTYSKINRILTDHRKPQDRLPPLWFTEGLAEFWSTDWDSQGEMVMRDAVLNDIAVGLNDMDRIYGTFLMYKEGQSVLEYISARYGEEKILLLMENFWKTAFFGDVLKLTLGKDYEEFDQEWLYALKKRFYPLLAQNDAPSKASVAVTSQGYNFKPVVVEGESTRTVLFISNRTGYTGIYRKKLDTPEREDPAELIIEGEQTDQFEAFHPFRTRIDVSKLGILAFAAKSGESDALYLYDLAAGKVVQSFQSPEVVSVGTVSWSPDARRLVLSAIDKSGDNDLYVLDTETGALDRLTRDYYDDRDPAWSPRGDRIAFSSDRTSYGRGGKYNLFLYDLNSRTIDYLTYGNQNDGSPSWSKDGKQLAYTSDRDGIQNIWVLQMSEARPARSSLAPEPSGTWLPATRLTRFVTSAFDPAWTASGDLVFGTFEKFNFQVKMLRNVTTTAETTSAVTPVAVLEKEKPWRITPLSGESEVQRFKYEGEYSLDVAQSVISTDPVFGTRGGAIVALSDLLGNEQYYFLIYNTAQSQDELLSSFNVAISRISLGQRTQFAYGIFRFTGRRYDLTDPDVYFYERLFGGYLTLAYPLTQFQRLETSISIANSRKELDEFIESRRSLLLSNSIAYIHDNSLWGPTGPLDGSRLNVTLAYTSDIEYSNANYFSVIFDYRKYFRLGLRSAFASRYWLFYNEGTYPRRFFMGGSWDLRGYPQWSIRGEKLWLMSQELRFPFVDQIAVRFPFTGLSFWSIRGALFFDVGGAWDNVYRETLGAMGFGFRMNFGGALAFRYDIGKRIEDNFGQLQKGLFYQFFFGWDF